MNFNYNTLVFIGIIAACLIGCDSFENDTEPLGEEVLNLETSVVALPGTSLFIDLSDKINTSEVIAFGIEKAPSKGDAKISENAILNYTPYENFLSGDDLMTIKLINQSGSIIDLDSIVISMGDTLDIPCFNGALSDYYQISENTPILIEPILNDGYCVDETSGTVINFTSEPQNGELESIELFTYQYTPDSGFVGTDSFMYELELIDDEGNSELSLAQINIEVINLQDSTSDSSNCIVIYPDSITLITPFDQYYTIVPFTNLSPACSILDWELNILSVTNGEAVTSSDGLIQYYPANYTNSDYAIIEYNFTFLDRLITNSLAISFQDSVYACDTLLNANDDFFNLNLVDSTNLGSYRYEPTFNDTYCSDSYISILTEPDLGVVSVEGTKSILYATSEEFTGTMTTSFLYELCDGATCDTATITFEITK